jgi:type III secretion protein C
MMMITTKNFSHSRNILKAFLCLFLLFSSAFTTASANSLQEEVYEENSLSKDRYLIRYDNISIIEYIKFISSISNKNFIFEEDDLQFNITVFSEEPTSSEDIISTLLQILRVHDLSLIEQGNNFLIHKNAEVTQLSKVISDDLKEIATDATEIITRIFRLKNVNPERIATIIKPMVSKGSLVEISKETRHLIVTDINANIEKISQILESLDTPNTSLDIGVYMAKNAYLDSLVNLANKILEPLKEENSLILVAHQSSESIFIISTPYLIDRATSVLTALDVTSPIGQEEELPSGHMESTGFYIHKLQYQSGRDIESSLKAIGNSLTTANSGNKQVVVSISSMKWVESTNSLLFTGDSASLQKIKDLVNNLDFAPRQVFIEVLVVDTSIKNSLNFGVDWGANLPSTAGDAAAGVGTGMGFGPGGKNANGQFAIPGIMDSSSNPVNNLSSQGFNFNIIGRYLTKTTPGGDQIFSSLGALVKALAGDTQTSILLSPRIIAHENSPAYVFVGEEIRIKTSEENSKDTAVSSTSKYEYKEIGAKLTVTPTLSNDDIVTLVIDQEISTAPEGIIIDTAGPSKILKSVTRTTAHVPDQHFLILSGMIRNEKTRQEQKVPCLGGIPLMGGAFKNSSAVDAKRNIMIFIRPHIVSSTEEIDKLTRREEKLLQKNSKKSTHINEVDFGLRHLNLRRALEHKGPVHLNKRPGSDSLYLNLDKDAHPDVPEDVPGLDHLKVDE